MKWFQILAVTAFVGSVAGSKILVTIFTNEREKAERDKEIFLVTKLADMGHHVTVYRPYTSKPHENVTEILILDGGTNVEVPVIDESRLEQCMAQHCSCLQSSADVDNLHPPRQALGMKLADIFGNLVLNTRRMKELINSDDKKFDVLISEIFLNEALVGGLSHKFNAALFGFCTPYYHVWDQSHIPEHDKLMQQHFGKDLPHLGVILQNAKNYKDNRWPDSIEALVNDVQNYLEGSEAEKNLNLNTFTIDNMKEINDL